MDNERFLSDQLLRYPVTPSPFGLSHQIPGALESIIDSTERMIRRLEAPQDFPVFDMHRFECMEPEQQVRQVDYEERNRVLDWISPVEYEIHFDNISESKCPGTCDWLLGHRQYREWIESPSSRLLHMRGPSGCGKSVLTTAVVEQLKNETERPIEGLAYFFCKCEDQYRREALPVLRSLVRQLASSRDNPSAFRKSILVKRERASLRSWQLRRLNFLSQGKAADTDCKLTVPECREQLIESINLYGITYIILDGLDEVDPDQLHVLLGELGKVMSQTLDGNFKLFLSGGSTENTGIDAAGLSVAIRPIDTRGDIEKFLAAEVDHFQELHEEFPINTIKENIVNRIVESCDGIFLCADIHMSQLLWKDFPSLAWAEEKLKTLPKGLEATYAQLWKEAEEHGPHLAQKMKHALMWVMFAPHPMKTKDILAAVRLDVDNRQIKLLDVVGRDSLLQFLRNLLKTDSYDRLIFYHRSTREFFMDHPDFTKGRSEISQICFLSLLKTFDPYSGGRLAFHSQNPFNPTHQFSRHLQTCWPFYAQTLTRDDAAFQSLKEFIGPSDSCSPCFKRWYSKVFPDRTRMAGIRSLEIQNLNGASIAVPQFTASPIFAIVYFSLHELFSEYLEDFGYRIWARNIADEKLITVAAKVGCLPICEALVGKGIPVRKLSTEEFSCSALANAAYYGRLDVVKYLVKRAAEEVSNLPEFAMGGEQGDIRRAPEEEIAAKKELYNALEAAVRGGHVNVMRCLVEEGKADAKDHPSHGSLLATAAERGNPDVVKYLVEEAKMDLNVPPQAWLFNCPLVIAIRDSNMGLLRYLVEDVKTDVNILYESGLYGNPLGVAASSGNREIVKYLVEVGKADIDLLDRDGVEGNALSSAAGRGHLEVVKYLVEKGADVNLQFGSEDRPRKNALRKAALLEELDVVKYLVEEAGADLYLLLLQGDRADNTYSEPYRGEVLQYIQEYVRSRDSPMST
ncbi:hypothetical protein N7456_003872 [Penicillium angulare]|uniref:Nephrocystin 3-like N-terminal domain-containing protein n=1 Tax=Penicillium angulare TaxID=116970 RepID=A0A9W9FX66_9EURO|nr:hypothetical protein N7456_003872 [Penicillium angulare]